MSHRPREWTANVTMPHKQGWLHIVVLAAAEEDTTVNAGWAAPFAAAAQP